MAFFFLMLTTRAQQPGDVYKFFDAGWKPVKEKKAVYLLRIRFTKDSCWQFSYYNMFGPLIRIETYQDQKATVRQGLFAWYNEGGNLDSSGYYDRGLPDEDWIYPVSGDKSHQSQYYEKGKLLNDKEFKEKLKAEEIIDPAYPDLTRLSPESYFPGGADGWMQYLNANLKYPNRAVDNFVKGTVVVLFLVEPTGKIQQPEIFQSVELSIDDEAIRLIDHSPAWVPAIRFERKVRSFKKQPFGFRLQASNGR